MLAVVPAGTTLLGWPNCGVDGQFIERTVNHALLLIKY
jgi:hypothetical protein